MDPEPSDTETVAMRLASAERSSELKLLTPVRLCSVHENMPIIARAMPPLVSVRFMMPLMNRATGFSQAARPSSGERATPRSRSGGRRVATGNAAETARIYIRQAKRSFRHCEVR